MSAGYSVVNIHPMAKAETTLEVDGREVRISSADRVIFPATGRTAEVTKLQIAEYYVAVGDGIMRALRERPQTLERGPQHARPARAADNARAVAEGRPRGHDHLDPRGPQGRGLLPKACSEGSA